MVLAPLGVSDQPTTPSPRSLVTVPGLTQAPTPPIRWPGPPSSRPQPTRPALLTELARLGAAAAGLASSSRKVARKKGGSKGGTSSRDVAAPRAESPLRPTATANHELGVRARLAAWRAIRAPPQALLAWPCASLCSTFTFIPALQEVLLREDNMAMVYVLPIYKEFVAVQRVQARHHQHAWLGRHDSR